MENEAGYHEGDDDYRPEFELELESCANRDGVEIVSDCYDYGFCAEKERGREVVMPIEAGWETYYWIPTVYNQDASGPAMCQNKYEIMGVQNLEWWYDDWMCDEDEMDSNLCQWIVVNPDEDMSRDSTSEMWIWFNVEIAGTSRSMYFY